MKDCWYCGSATKRQFLEDGPPGLSLCHRCIKTAVTASPQDRGEKCVGCSGVIGARRWLLGPRKLAGLRKRNAETLCLSCLTLFKSIVKEREYERRSADSPPVRPPEAVVGVPLALIGQWRLVRTENPASVENVTMEFRPDGSLQYSIQSGDRLQIMNLTYAVSGNVIVSNQPSAPGEERTHFSLGADERLELDHGGTRSWYERVV